MTFSSSPIFVVVLMLSVVVYLGAVTYLITYLRHAYMTTWVGLGGFTMRRRQFSRGVIEWYVAGFRTLAFILFSNQYRAVPDRQLTFLIWLVRISLALYLVLMLVLISSGLIPR